MIKFFLVFLFALTVLPFDSFSEPMEKAFHYERTEMGVRLISNQWSLDILGFAFFSSEESEGEKNRTLSFLVSPALGFRIFAGRKLQVRFLADAELTDRQSPGKSASGARVQNHLGIEIIRRIDPVYLGIGSKIVSFPEWGNSENIWKAGIDPVFVMGVRF